MSYLTKRAREKFGWWLMGFYQFFPVYRLGARLCNRQARMSAHPEEEKK